jgi:hypothetical protein
LYPIARRAIGYTFSIGPPGDCRGGLLFWRCAPLHPTPEESRHAPAAAQSICLADHDALIGQLAQRYGEAPVGAGLAPAPQPGAGSALVELYANAATGTWSLVVTLPGRASCLAMAGEGWRGVDLPSPVDPQAYRARGEDGSSPPRARFPRATPLLVGEGA